MRCDWTGYFCHETRHSKIALGRDDQDIVQNWDSFYIIC